MKTGKNEKERKKKKERKRGRGRERKGKKRMRKKKRKEEKKDFRFLAGEVLVLTGLVYKLGVRTVEYFQF